MFKPVWDQTTSTPLLIKTLKEEVIAEKIGMLITTKNVSFGLRRTTADSQRRKKE